MHLSVASRWDTTASPTLTLMVPLLCVVVGISAAGELWWGLSVALVLGAATWAMRPRNEKQLERRFVVVVWLLAFSPAMPAAGTGLLEISAIGFAVIEWLRGSKHGLPLLVVTVGLLGYWLLLSVHPNVPSLEMGLVGLRKTVLPLTGLFLGLAVSRHKRPALAGHVIASIAALLAVSIFIHLYLPGLETSIPRSAGESTALFNNQARLQGLMPGAFHVALAATIVILWTAYSWPLRKGLATVALLIGVTAVYMAFVRTAYVAIAVAAICVLLWARDRSRRYLRLAGLTVVGGGLLWLGLAIGGQSAALLESLQRPTEDSRLMNRTAFYREAVDMIAQSPVFGWGPGSAGDTLEVAFAGKEHVNAHNFLLKVLAEGGAVGLILWIALIVAIFRSFRRDEPLSALGAGALVAMGVFGVTGSAVEAMPVAFFAFVLVGIGYARDEVRVVDSIDSLESTSLRQKPSRPDEEVPHLVGAASGGGPSVAGTSG